MAIEKPNLAAGTINIAGARIQAGGKAQVGYNIRAEVVEHEVIDGASTSQPEEALVQLISEKENLEKKKEALLEKTFYNAQQLAVKTKEELNARIRKFEAKQKEAIADGEEFPPQKLTYLDACKTTLESLNHLDKEIQAIERKIRQQQGIPEIHEEIQADEAKVDGNSQIGSNVEGPVGTVNTKIIADQATVTGGGQIGSNVRDFHGNVDSRIRSKGAIVTDGGQIGGNHTGIFPKPIRSPDDFAASIHSHNQGDTLMSNERALVSVLPSSFSLQEQIPQIPPLSTLVSGDYLDEEKHPTAYAIIHGENAKHVLQRVDRDQNARYLLEKDEYDFGVAHHTVMARRVDLLQDQTFIQDLDWSPNKYGLAPIHLAVHTGRREILEVCLQHSEVNLCFDLTQQLVLPANVVGKQRELVSNLKLTSFHMAILLGKEEIMDVFLKRPDIRWDVPGLGNVFHLAVLANQPFVIQELLRDERNWNLLDATDAVGMCVLSYAAACDRPFMIDALLRHYQRQGEKSAKLNQMSEALAYAVAYGSVKAVNCLLKYDDDGRILSNYVTLPHENRGTDARARAQTLTAQHLDDGRLIKIRNRLMTHDHHKNKTRYRYPNLQEERIDNLVFQGGGIKGVAYVGALEVLSQKLRVRESDRREKMVRDGREEKEAADANHSGDFPGIQRVAGTSAGAITSLFIAFGFTVTQIRRALETAPFDEFLGVDIEKLKSRGALGKLQMVNQQLDPGASMWRTLFGPLFWYQNFLGTEGLCDGTRIVGWLSEQLSTHLEELARNNPGMRALLPDNLLQKIGDVKTLTLTLGDLNKLIASGDSRFKHLHIIVTRLAEQDNDQPSIERIHTEGSNQSNPWSDVLVVDAIRASMSIPGAFTPWQLRRRAQNGSISVSPNAPRYVDGGMLKNYPIECFDHYRYAMESAHQAGDEDYRLQNRATLGFRLYTPPVEVRDDKNDGGTPSGWHQQIAVHLQEFLNAMKDRVTPDPLHKPAVQLIKALASCYWSAEDMIAEFDGSHTGRTIQISNIGMGALDFDMSDSQRGELLEAGRAGVRVFFGDNSSAQNLAAPDPRERLLTHAPSAVSSSSSGSGEDDGGPAYAERPDLSPALPQLIRPVVGENENPPDELAKTTYARQRRGGERPGPVFPSGQGVAESGVDTPPVAKSPSSESNPYSRAVLASGAAITAAGTAFASHRGASPLLQGTIVGVGALAVIAGWFAQNRRRNAGASQAVESNEGAQHGR